MADDDMTELLATVRELKNRQEIRDCIVRESRARDRQDVEQIESCWWPDGVDEHGPSINRFPEYPLLANKGHQTFFRQTSHNITNHLCNLDGDGANCESYVIGALAWKDGSRTTIAIGRYLDRLERRGGEWRLLVRRCTIEMSADCDPNWILTEPVRGFLQGIWSKEDPSYDQPYEWKPREEGIRW